MCDQGVLSTVSFEHDAVEVISENVKNHQKCISTARDLGHESQNECLLVERPGHYTSRVGPQQLSKHQQYMTYRSKSTYLHSHHVVRIV